MYRFHKNLSGIEDIKDLKLSYDEASDLREEISEKINKALRDGGIGKWTGGTYNLYSIEIFIRTDKPDEAIRIIERVMHGYRLRDCMEIIREGF